MKIVILDGQVQPNNKKWSGYMRKLSAELLGNGHEVKHYILKDHKINRCTGCFGCWVKTPGVCVIKDDSPAINRAIIQADFLLWASPLVMGFPSSYLKNKFDRFIPLIHPYFEVVNGEAHHLSRYPKYPLYGLLMQPGRDDSPEDVRLVAQIFSRTALNAKSRLTFSATTDQTLEDVLSQIENHKNLTYQQPHIFTQKELTRISPPKNLLVINGSPRGPRGNTPVMLQKFMEGYMAVEGVQARVLHLAGRKDMREVMDAWRKADSVMLGFPLYTDSMPGVVKEFIESLGNGHISKNSPAMGYLVQSGFPEAAHSRHVEQYLMRLSERLNSPYLGTLVRGGCEGVRLMPESWNKKMFATLEKLGAELAGQGGFVPISIREMVAVEKYPSFAAPVFKLLVQTPMLQTYWNNQLKKNGAFDRRFDQPYLN